MNFKQQLKNNTCVFFKKLAHDFSLDGKSNLMLYLKCFIIFLLQFLSFVYKPIVFLELAYVIFLILFDKYENKIYYLFFMLPFYNVFRYDANSVQYENVLSNLLNVSFSIWPILLFCILFSIRFVKDLIARNKQIKLVPTIIYFVVYLCLLFPVTKINSESILYFLILSSLFLSLFLIFQYRKEFELKKVLNIWFFGILGTVIIYCFYPILPNLQPYIVHLEERISFLEKDPNFLAFEYMTVLSAYSVLFFGKKVNFSYFIVFVALTVLGLLSCSKSFFICYIIFLLILLVLLAIKAIENVKKGKFKLKVVIIVSLIVLLCIGTMVGLFYDTISFLFERLLRAFKSNGSLEDVLNILTTDRLDIWLNYINIIFNNISYVFFGRGVMMGYEYRPCHNTLIQFLYFAGLPLTLFIIGVSIYFVIKNRKTKKVFNYIPIIVLLIFACSLDFLISYRTYLILTVCLLCMGIKNSDVDKKGKQVLEKNFNNVESSSSLSVIIPIYNVEKYLVKCVESFINLNLKNTEIILVDDGSTDSSGIIADDLGEKYSQVKVFHKENGGLSDARNYGIKQATGDYVTFIDSDDFVNENFTSIYNYLNYGSDIIFSGYNAYYLKKTKTNAYSEFGIYEKVENVVENCLNMTSKFNSACVRVVKKEFIIKKNLWFENGFAEDFNWLGRAIVYTNSAILTPLVYYEYIAEREGSIMNTYKKNRFLYVISHANSIISNLKNVDISKSAETRVRQYVGFNILTNFRKAKYLNKEDYLEVMTLLKNNKNLIKYQKSIYMKIFYLFGNLIGFDKLYKLV